MRTTNLSNQMPSGPILVVDDDDSIRETIVEFLDFEGYAVLGAATAAEALAIMTTHRPALLITDLSMPEMDGISLIHVTQEHDPKLPAILLTGFSDEATAQIGGVNCVVLRKPVQMSTLIQHMAVLLKQV
jgi:CheY-like chemotaxis protein